MAPLSFALIGCGKFGKNYLRLLQEIEGIKLHTVVDKIEPFKLPSGIQYSSDASEAFKNPDIDCVVIVTPPSTHLELAAAALEAQKHVLVEKPMVLTTEKAKELENIVKESGRIFMVGYQYVFNNYVRFIKEKIESDEFGTLQSITMEHMQSPPREDVDVFLDAAPHPLSILHHIFPQATLKSVSGKLENITGGTQDDTAHAAVEFNNGPTLNINAAWHSPKKIRLIMFKFEKAQIRFEPTVPRLTIITQGEEIISEIPSTEPLKEEIKHFIKCIRENKKPLTDIVFGSLITEWLETISQEISK